MLFRHTLLISTALILLPGSLFAAGPKQPAWADPVQAAAEDPDFSLQGEFAGELGGENEKKEGHGVQVIAMGQGRFQAVSYQGGLPGAGWDGDRSGIQRFDAQRNDKGQVIFLDAESKISGELTAAALIIRDGDGKEVGRLPRVNRKSPTLGAPAPAGAVVLFDGTRESLEKHWKSGARMTEDGLLMEGVNGIDTFGSATIHVEFRLSYMPAARGQGRSNSGLYVQSRYETQMLDSFGLEGKNNETGGVYSVRDPDLNLCLPPLVWQTYDIDFTAAEFDASGKKTKNARMTVKLNGVVVQPDIEVDHATTASPLKEGPEPGPLHLQNHGNPVRYRNIWVLPKN